MGRLTRGGIAEPVSRDQILRHERGQGNIYFPCSADHEQDWRPYPVDTYSCYMCDHTRPVIMRKRRTKIYSTEMCSFLCSKRPRKMYVFTFSDRRYGPQKKRVLQSLGPFSFTAFRVVSISIFELKNSFRFRQTTLPFYAHTVTVGISQLLSRSNC